MADRRYKNFNWNLKPLDSNNRTSLENIRTALLMDIRDELRSLNALLHCHNAVSIPALLRAIKTNTTKKRRARKKING